MADATPKISLSLLDLLFCAFGGVIVMAVVFIAISGKPSGKPLPKSGHLEIRLKVKGGDYLNAVELSMYLGDQPTLNDARVLIKDSSYFQGAKYIRYLGAENKPGRMNFIDFEMDTLNVYAIFTSNMEVDYLKEQLEFEVARFVNGEWDTILLPSTIDVPQGFNTTPNRPLKFTIPLK